MAVLLHMIDLVTQMFDDLVVICSLFPGNLLASLVNLRHIAYLHANASRFYYLIPYTDKTKERCGNEIKR